MELTELTAAMSKAVLQNPHAVLTLMTMAIHKLPDSTWEHLYERWRYAYPQPFPDKPDDADADEAPDCALLPAPVGDFRGAVPTSVVLDDDEEGKLNEGNEHAVSMMKLPLSAGDWLSLVFNRGRFLEKEHVFITLMMLLPRDILDNMDPADLSDPLHPAALNFDEALADLFSHPHTLELVQSLRAVAIHPEANAVLEIVNWPGSEEDPGVGGPNGGTEESGNAASVGDTNSAEDAASANESKGIDE